MANRRKIKKSDIKTIKWLAQIGKKHMYMVVLIIIANAVWASMSVVFASFSRNVIDGAVEKADKAYIIKYAVLLLVVITVQLALNLFSNSFSQRCKGRLDMDYKRYMLKTIMSKDFSSVSAYHSGELQNRIFNDVDVVTTSMTTIVPDAVFYIVRLLCAFIYLVIIARVFALVFVVGGIFIVFCMSLFRGTLKRLHKNVQETEGRTRSFFQETLLNLLVVKSFSAEDKVLEHSDGLLKDNYKAVMKRRFMRIASQGGIASVFNLGYVFALTYGAFKLLDHSITYGTVTAMLQLVNQVQGPFANLSNLFPKYFSMIASAERLIEICSLPDEPEDNKEDINPRETYKNMADINFDNISFKYDRDLILDNTSLKVNKGDFVAIMGISGIGKSTLLKLLLGVFKVNGGGINIELNDGSSIPVDRHTRRLFSYVPQGDMLISGTIRQNLTFINTDATDAEIEEAVRISCARDFIKDLPNGIDTVIGEKGSGLSEGQLQRLAIARSLLSKSPVLLLDEATSALDEDTERRFLSNLRSLKNVTCIIVSHKKAALDICDKYVRIENAKIISEKGKNAENRN